MNVVPIKERPLNKKRISTIIERMKSAFEKNNTIRHIFPIRQSNPDVDAVGFIKIGHNQLVDRGFLVDNTALKTFYAYEGLGDIYGRNAALAELDYVVKTLLKKRKKFSVVSVTKKITQDYLQGVVKSSLGKHSFDTIFTSLENKEDFCTMKQFKPDYSSGIPYLEGSILGMKLFWFNAIPKGITLIFNSQQVGEVLEKEMINLTVFENLDAEKIKSSIPSFNKSDIEKKVRILVYEVIKFNMMNLKSVILLENLPSEL